jgi:hypothetical protein
VENKAAFVSNTQTLFEPDVTGRKGEGKSDLRYQKIPTEVSMTTTNFSNNESIHCRV